MAYNTETNILTSFPLIYSLVEYIKLIIMKLHNFADNNKLISDSLGQIPRIELRTINMKISNGLLNENQYNLDKQI
jgi:hypothetical protein